jgi:predicted neuraminidase
MFCRHPPVQLDTGNWILPAYRSTQEGGAFGRDFSVVAHLNEKLDKCIEISEIENSIGRVHGCIVKAQHGGAFLQFFRSRLADRIYRSIGSPDGRAWTEPHPVSLPNNNSSFQILRVSNGPLVAVYNRFGLTMDSAPPWGEAIWPQTRWPISVAVSVDEGLTWPWVRDIDFGNGYCGQENWINNHQMAYPTITEGKDQRLHIAYSWGNRMAIKYMSIHLDDVVR